MAEIPDKLAMPASINEEPQQQSGGVKLSTQAPGETFEIPVLALQNTTLFPDTVVPLAVGRPRSVAAVEAALATQEKLVACVTVRSENTNNSQDARSADLYEVGTLVTIKRMERVENTIQIIAQGTERIRVVEWK